jgi:endoglucanase
MDACGFMISSVHEGFLQFTEIGGFDPRLLPGQEVIVHGQKDFRGVIMALPDRLLPTSQRGTVIALEDLIIDVGLLPSQVAQLIKVGDIVSLAQQPLQMGEHVIVGHSQDNRASVAVVSECLVNLQHMVHEWDVWAVATVQEEESFAGALTSPFEIRPEIAIAIDVTFAKSHGSTDWQTFGMDKGPTIGMGPNIHPALFKKCKDLAEKLEITHQKELNPRHSGTDAFAMQIVAEGIPTLVIGIPLRYMHSPVEMVHYRDIERAGRLLAEFICALDQDYKVTYDEVKAK